MKNFLLLGFILFSIVIFSGAADAFSPQSYEVANSYLQHITNHRSNLSLQIIEQVKRLPSNATDHRVELCPSYSAAEALNRVAQDLTLFHSFPGPGTEGEGKISSKLLSEYSDNLMNLELNFKAALNTVRYLCNDISDNNTMTLDQQERVLSQLKDFNIRVKRDLALREKILKALHKN